MGEKTVYCCDLCGREVHSKAELKPRHNPASPSSSPDQSILEVCTACQVILDAAQKGT